MINYIICFIWHSIHIKTFGVCVFFSGWKRPSRDDWFRWALGNCRRKRREGTKRGQGQHWPSGMSQHIIDVLLYLQKWCFIFLCILSSGWARSYGWSWIWWVERTSCEWIFLFFLHKLGVFWINFEFTVDLNKLFFFQGWIGTARASRGKWTTRGQGTNLLDRVTFSPEISVYNQ